jgi:hypothetical protein
MSHTLKMSCKGLDVRTTLFPHPLFVSSQGVILPPHPLLKAEVTHPCLQANVTILEVLGNDEQGRPVYSVLAPPFPSLPRNDTFFGQDSSSWSDYDLARRRQSPSYTAIKRTVHGFGKGVPLTKDAVCSLARQHYAV